MIRLARTALLCLFAALLPASVCHAQDQGYSAHIATIVEALAGERAFVNGMAQGLSASLDQGPSFKALDDQYPGFRAAAERDILAAATTMVGERYPTLRPRLDAMARAEFPPVDAKTAADYLASGSGRRFLLSWGRDDETDLSRYWTRYSTRHDADVPEAVRTTDRAFGRTRAFRALAKLNLAYADALATWGDGIAADLELRMPAILQANLDRLGRK